MTALECAAMRLGRNAVARDCGFGVCARTKKALHHTVHHPFDAHFALYLEKRKHPMKLRLAS